MSNEKHNLLLNEVDDYLENTIDWDDYKIGYFLQKNKLKEKDNEDSLLIIEKNGGVCLAIADGAGGHPRGKDASRLVCEAIRENLEESSLSGLDVIQTFELANEKVLDLKIGAHSTLTVCTIHDHFMRAYSVGDSEVLYTNSSGTSLYSNIPQSPVGHEIEAGIIDQTESLEREDRNLVNNLMGDELLRIEVGTKINFKKGHNLLIGSDGIFDNIPHEKLIEIISNGVYEKSFEELKNLCIASDPEKGWLKDDDISFIFIRRMRVTEAQE